MEEGPWPVTLLVFWISITSGRNFRRFAGCSEEERSVCNKEPAVRRSSARGRVEEGENSSSMDMSEPESSAPDEASWLPMDCLLLPDVLLFCVLAHAGVGCSRSYCLRSLLMYSLPLTTSSASVSRSFRKRVLEARETVMRSSSLSIHADWRS